MATSTQNIQGAQFVQDLGKDYGTQLAGLTAVPLNTDLYAPQVAAQDAQQTQAYNLTGSGIGAYQPYISSAESYSGPTGYQSFMSPYQTDVIDASLASFDQQAGQGLQGIADQATMSGNLGGGREGVQRANYQAQSDLNRALLESGLLQQGFTQGNQLAQNAFSQQQSLANQVPSLNIQDVGQLGTMGGLQQAQAQAGLDATREQNRMRAQEPYERLGTYGQGVASLMSGYPGQYQTSTVPNPTPLQTALGTASVLGGIFGGNRNNNIQQTAQQNAGIYSDVRLKTDIKNVGKSSSGINIYSFKYLGDKKTYQGVMAQEVPWASTAGENGYLKVDYSKVDVEFKRVN